MTVVGIIPARGGSKGIRKKNITPFLGEPLITHTIEQARESEHLDGIYVSTDDDEIADVSRSAGATVIERPVEIAGDFASTEDALLHAVDVLEDRGISPEILVLLQCTSPLRRETDIDDAIELVRIDEYDSALSCCEDHKFYWTDGEDGANPINYDPQERSMRQELKQRYQENGSIYVMKIDVLKEQECRLGGSVGIHEMPEALSFEIDTPTDLKLLEGIARTIDI